MKRGAINNYAWATDKLGLSGHTGTQSHTAFFFFNKFIYFFNASELYYLFIYLFIYLAVLGLCFCARAFSSCGERGPLFIAVRGPVTVAASFVAEHRLQTRRLSSCGSRAPLLCGMWDLPRPGLEPVSPALAGRFSTTAPPGKPSKFIYLLFLAALGLRCSTWAFSSCGEWGLLFVAVCRLLIVVASLVAEHRL